MLEFRYQCFVVQFITDKIQETVKANIRSLGSEDCFEDLEGQRQLLDNLYYLHARAEDTKAYHFSAQDAHEALSAYHPNLRSTIEREFRELALKTFGDYELVDKVFG